MSFVSNPPRPAHVVQFGCFHNLLHNPGIIQISFTASKSKRLKSNKSSEGF
jgi:hypothetical protein